MVKKSLFWKTKKLCKLIDKSLYEKINRSEIKPIRLKIKKNLSNVPIELRYASADCELLYFITRKFKPAIILETGVAIGYSTSYFLSAIKKNNLGKLYSSDFMYLGIKDSKNYIGYLPKKLKFNHDKLLFKDGDEFNIPKILNKLNKKNIELFHYDSDKSYRAKEKSLKLISNKVSKKIIYIFDDIQDDFFFKDFVKKNNLKYLIIQPTNKNKYIGIAGSFLEKII